jgi:uncharacterized membrane protein YdbT with pleckstrin-like domain
MYTDNHIKTLSPSQLINLGFFAVGIIDLLFLHIFIGVLLAIFKYIEVSCWKYEFNERTVIERKGIFNVERREIHYYRIKSIMVDEPLWMRFFGLANVTVKTSDPYHPEFVLHGVPNGVVLRNELRVTTDKRRKEENVREFDLYNL